MWSRSSRPTRIMGLVLSLLLLGQPGSAGEAGLPAFDRDGPVRIQARLASADPCLFFRSQAYGRGLDSYASDMLIACQEIAHRRSAGVPLGDRLTATDAMLETYRQAVVTAGTEAMTRKPQSGRAPWALGLSLEEKYAIADATGALLAMEAIREGF